MIRKLSEGPLSGISLENYGTRTIRAVEWEYEYIVRGGSNPETGPLSPKEPRWKRIKSKVRIGPNTAASIRTADLPPNDRAEYEPYLLPGRAGEKQTGGLFALPTMIITWARLCRIVYTEGPDWFAR